MKDSEFIDLLNLYLDHEISAADAARLEAEVLKNPSRRHIYRDYCRMQKACKILAQDFVEDAAPANAKVIDFASARRASRVGWVMGGSLAAAAACAALVFVSVKREAPLAPMNAPMAVHDVKIPAKSEAVAAAERTLPQTVAVPPARGEAPPALASALLLSGNKQVPTPQIFVGADANAPQFDWLNTVQVAPMQGVSFEEFRRLEPNTPRPAVKRPLGQGRGPVEWTAIRYTK